MRVCEEEDSGSDTQLRSRTHLGERALLSLSSTDSGRRTCGTRIIIHSNHIGGRCSHVTHRIGSQWSFTLTS